MKGCKSKSGCVQKQARNLKQPLQVHDLASDPAEARDLAAERPEMAARLEAALEAARRPSVHFRLPGEPEPAPAEDPAEGAEAGR